ncbi:remorin-like [Bidens hawaiensis]|uniref:remorin-like n=1 Tax=Bidens hawaiensis TaxID=980011 RepID=UPI00404B87E2
MVAEETSKVEAQPNCPAEADTEPVPEQKPTDDVVVENSEKPGSKHRDEVLARVATEKKDALIKAWEESEISKIDNRAQKKLAAIRAWENSKKAELEAELKKIKEKLEKKKAKYTEKMKNKIALVHKTAEEKRAITEAKRGEDVLKAEELAAKCRATGSSPKKLTRWFSSS